MSVAHIRKLQENTAALVQNGCSPIRVGAISGSRYVYPDKFETPSSPIRRHAPDAKYPDEMCRMQDIRVESARQPDGMAAQSGVMAAAAGCKLAAAGCNDSILSRYVIRMPSDGVSGLPVRIYSLHSGFF